MCVFLENVYYDVYKAQMSLDNCFGYVQTQL